MLIIFFIKRTQQVKLLTLRGDRSKVIRVVTVWMLQSWLCVEDFKIFSIWNILICTTLNYNTKRFVSHIPSDFPRKHLTNTQLTLSVLYYMYTLRALRAWNCVFSYLYVGGISIWYFLFYTTKIYFVYNFS